MIQNLKAINNKWNYKCKEIFSFQYKLRLIFFLFLSYIILLISVYYNSEDNLDSNLIKIAYYCDSLKYGGVERVISLLINYLSKEKIFSQYLITNQKIFNGEYYIPNTTKRISLSGKKTSLFEVIYKKHIDILIYNFYNKREIEKLNSLKRTKIIYYNHSSFLYWIYLKIYNFKDTIYYSYKKCNYVISLIPVENDYLFKKWGIHSILMHNPISYEYDNIIPSNLSKQNIVMIGRSNDPIKRYDLGIKSMKNIIKELPTCQMNIISNPNIDNERLIHDLNLEKNVRFIGFQEKIEIYLRNSSLHILPSLSESYPMVLGETKIFGIPSILCGLDYIALAKGGTVIIYDDNPNTIAKEAIKILKFDKYRRKLGKEARKSMEKLNNKIIVKKWLKLILSIYKGDEKSYQELLYNEGRINEEEANKILNNQLELLRKRNPHFKQLTLNRFKLYSFE